MADRFIIVWLGMVRNRYLREFLPGGAVRWTENRRQARLYATRVDASEAAEKARRSSKRQGLRISIGVGER